MGLFSIFSKKSKPNLTPDVAMPKLDDLPFTNNDASARGYSLRDFAANRISGKTPVGFGEDFLSRTTNAPIASREARFTNQEMPFINSQLSARGVGRSAGRGLATDVVNQASLQKERDIQDLLSQFYLMNELQKKTDMTQALNLAKDINVQAGNLETNRASASERLSERTADQTNLRNEQSRQDADSIGNVLASMAIGGVTGGMGGGGSSGALTGALGGAQTSISPQANIAGSESSLDELIAEYMRRQQGGGSN